MVISKRKYIYRANMENIVNLKFKLRVSEYNEFILPI